MQIHNLKRKNPLKKVMIVGRGGKRGKTSGRGGKGQTARAGHKIRPELRDMIKRLPKLRGRGVNQNKAFAVPAVAVNLAILDKNFSAGDTVSPLRLFEKGVIRKVKGKFPPVKIMSNGELTKKLIIKNCLISKTAITKLEKSGSVVN